MKEFNYMFQSNLYKKGSSQSKIDLEDLLAEYNKLFSIIEQVDDGMVVTDPNQKENPIIFVNHGFSNLTQYSIEEALGKNCRFLTGEKTDPQTIQEIREAIGNKQTIRTEILNYKKDGTPFWNELKISPIFDDQGELVYFVGIQSDITIRRNAEEMANYDALTSLPNRRCFWKELSSRLYKEEPFSIILLDIDDFKHINDSYGHIVGDDLLIEVSERLQNSVNDIFVARLGGDEFVMLLPLSATKKDLMEQVEAIVNEFRSPLFFSNKEKLISVSLGVACAPQHGKVMKKLVKKADSAMYDAKNTKGSSYTIYSNSLEIIDTP